MVEVELQNPKNGGGGWDRDLTLKNACPNFELRGSTFVGPQKASMGSVSMGG